MPFGTDHNRQMGEQRGKTNVTGMETRRMENIQRSKEESVSYRISNGL